MTRCVHVTAGGGAVWWCLLEAGHEEKDHQGERISLESPVDTGESE